MGLLGKLRDKLLEESMPPRPHFHPPRFVRCRRCRGRGEIRGRSGTLKPCPQCDGSGEEIIVR